MKSEHAHTVPDHLGEFAAHLSWSRAIGGRDQADYTDGKEMDRVKPVVNALAPEKGLTMSPE